MVCLSHSLVHISRGLILIDQHGFATTTVANPLVSNLHSVFEASKSVFELPKPRYLCRSNCPERSSLYPYDLSRSSANHITSAGPLFRV